MSDQTTLESIPTTSSAVFTYGVCCNAILVVRSVGLLSLLEQRTVNEDEITDNERYPDSIAVKGALKALQYGQIISKSEGRYSLTSLGKEIIQDIDGYIHWFEAYAKLLAKSVDIAQGRTTAKIGEDWDFRFVVYSGSLIKSRVVVPTLKELISELAPKGAICDYGCGTGETLIELCETFDVSGIGFEKTDDIADYANKNINLNTAVPIHIYYANNMQIKGIYPEVDIVISNIITHHIPSDEDCVELFHSFKHTFPNSRYLIVVDAYTPDEDKLNPKFFAPAFDYVHRLQRLETRGLESLKSIINHTQYPLLKEIKIEDIPYHYAWVFEMK